MELFELAKLGPQVVLDVVVLFIVIRYLPNLHKEMFETFRDMQEKMSASFNMMHKEMMEEIVRLSRQLNRLVSLWTNQLGSDDRKRQEMSDKVFDNDDDDDTRRRSKKEI